MNQQTLLDGLNQAQQAVVTADFGPILVLAGPGSGKTRVLIHRIAYLIHKKVPGFRILAITFTNKAANEMRRRIKALLGTKSDSQLAVTVGTFHGVCAKILRKHAAKAGLRSDFTILDGDQQLAVVKQALAQLNLAPALPGFGPHMAQIFPDGSDPYAEDLDLFDPRTVLRTISRLKCEGLGPDHPIELSSAIPKRQPRYLAQVAAGRRRSPDRNLPPCPLDSPFRSYYSNYHLTIISPSPSSSVSSSA